MAANQLALSVPNKKVSAWIAETNPKAARQWLDALPMADMAEASREIYQALYTLNRLEINPSERFKLMELYREPIATVTKSLQSHFQSSVLPLTPKRRKLAEFIREMQSEMAFGYKCAVRDLSTSRTLWGKKKLNAGAVEGALFYLGEILNKSYQVYIPYPGGVWQEIHALYRYAEENDWFGDSIAMDKNNSEITSAPYRCYLRITLLGLCNPYQLPEQEWQRIQQFLEHWGDRAVAHSDPTEANPVGQFLIDLSKDSPPTVFPKDVAFAIGGNYRVLNALGVSKVVQAFIVRLRKGESARDMDLGMECLDKACLDMLRRMIRFWGLGARRKRPRKKKMGIGLVTSGINAIHFFSSNQKPFSPPEVPVVSAGTPFDSLMERVKKQDEPMDVDSTFIDLDKVDIDEEHGNTDTSPAKPLRPVQEVYRVGRWHIEDESLGGMLMKSHKPHRQHLKVGEVLGIQDVSRDDQWRVGVVRWLKAPSESQMEMGIEMLAPGITPVAVRFADQPLSTTNPFMQALLLSSVAALHLPATLILPKNFYRERQALLLAEDDAGPRRIILLKSLSETTVFNQVVFADAAS